MSGVFPDKPVTKKAAETAWQRQGAVDHYVPSLTGPHHSGNRGLEEISARSTASAAYKLPIKTQIVAADLTPRRARGISMKIKEARALM